MTQSRTYPAIPTVYNGTVYRSRLEARWAAFFTQLPWAHEYEPIDLHGYIPDFLVSLASPLLVECKPFINMHGDDAEDTATACRRVEEGGWIGDALLVGAMLWPEPVAECSTFERAPLIIDGVFAPAPASPAPHRTRLRIGRMRCEGTTEWRDAYLGCVEVQTGDSLLNAHGDAVHTIERVWYPTVAPEALTSAQFFAARLAWATAGNETQWKPSERKGWGESVLAAARRNRVLPGVKFTATLAGAIHERDAIQEAKRRARAEMQAIRDSAQTPSFLDRHADDGRKRWSDTEGNTYNVCDGSIGYVANMSEPTTFARPLVYDDGANDGADE